MNRHIRINILLGFVALVFLAMFFIQPIPQDLKYHQFADQISLFGIPNAWNVLSNIPFMIVGVWGLFVLKHIDRGAETVGLKTLIIIFYVGLFCTGIGSGYYHLSPDNESLVWDRLPMTIAFMSLFSFILYMHIGQQTAMWAVWLLIALGVFSVFYWRYTESIGQGDLRLYALVQFLPMLLIPLIIFMFPCSLYKQSYIVFLIVIYIAAKLTEHFDVIIYELLGFSGHSLKHIIAAPSGWVLIPMLKNLQLNSVDS